MSRQFFADFKNDERGTASIESLFWIPMFIYLLVLITDVSLIFYGKAQALRIIQDGNRALSVKIIDDAPAAQAYILGRLQDYSPDATATTSVTDNIITTTASLKVRDLMSIGSLPGFNNMDIFVTSQHFLEQ
jgi:Flp pilus assembly protein TadG